MLPYQQLDHRLTVINTGNIWSSITRFIKGGGRASLGKELGLGAVLTMLLVFYAGLLYFNWTLASRRGALEKEWRGAVLQQASKSVLDIGREQASSVREPYTCLEEIEWEIQAKRKERYLKKIKERRMIILDVVSDSGLMHPDEFRQSSQDKTKFNLSILNNSTV